MTSYLTLGVLMVLWKLFFGGQEPLGFCKFTWGRGSLALWTGKNQDSFGGHLLSVEAGVEEGT